MKISQIQLASSRPCKPLIFKPPSFQDLTDGLVEIYIYISLTCLAHVWSRNFFHSSSALVFFLDPMTTQNPPPHDSGNKKLPWTRMGTLTRFLACFIFGGSRRKEAGLRWQDSHCLTNGVTTCSPGPNPGSTLDDDESDQHSDSTAISSFCTTYVTQDRRGHPGYRAVQLRLTCH